MTKTKFIYITDSILIKEEFTETFRGGIYEYYIGDNYVFGVHQRFTQDDLKNLYNTGYFDMWLDKEEA